MELPVWSGEGVRAVERLDDSGGVGVGVVVGVRRERRRKWNGENLKLNGLKNL